MIKRAIFSKLRSYLKIFPVVAIIGPRQAGKTTFVKNELKTWRYIDLEKPSDYNRVEADIEYFFQEYGEQCIIDEVQTLPELFPFLRSCVDSRRSRKGRAVLLGSVNPLLLKGISEPLSGRIGIIELEPFTYEEIYSHSDITPETVWLKGGYPEPLRWPLHKHATWKEQYVKTLVGRDILRHFQVSLSEQKQLQLMTMIAHLHGKMLNASEVASAFGISYHTVNAYIDILEKYFLINRLYPYFTNVGKRLVKHPKLYYRDTGILHYFLGIQTPEELKTSPYRGFSFEGFIIESLRRRLQATMRTPEFYYYRTAQGDEIDLLVKEGNVFTAYEIKTAQSINRSDLAGFSRCLEQLKIKKGTVVYWGKENYSLAPHIEVKAAGQLLR